MKNIKRIHTLTAVLFVGLAAVGASHAWAECSNPFATTFTFPSSGSVQKTLNCQGINSTGSAGVGSTGSKSIMSTWNSGTCTRQFGCYPETQAFQTNGSAVCTAHATSVGTSVSANCPSTAKTWKLWIRDFFS
jgi:hypothetical protein